MLTKSVSLTSATTVRSRPLKRKDTMISLHFDRQEFACQCGCGFSTVDIELLVVLEETRRHFNKPMIITSGCRCEPRNRIIGGVGGSKHMEGIAADFYVVGAPLEDVYSYINDSYPHKYGLGLYTRWIHFDARREKARW